MNLESYIKKYISLVKRKQKLIMLFNENNIFKVLSLTFLILYLFAGNKVEAKYVKICIVYDSYNEFGNEENKLNSLVNTCLQSESSVELLNMNSYLEGEIHKYDDLIILNNNNSNLPEALVKDLSNFKKNTIFIGNKMNLNTNENSCYIPKFSSNDIDYEKNKSYIHALINGEEKKQGKTYILIDKIDPFIDLNEFVRKIDFLKEHGLSFICSVMPVYENEHFEAMNNFCKVLRYAQVKGGKIILHSSVLFGENITGGDIKSKMDLSEQIYIRQGVYPLSLDIPEGFLYKEDYKELIGASNTIFLEKDKEIGIINEKKYSIKNFDRVINKVNIENGQVLKIDYGDIAIALNIDMDFKSFSNNIEKLLKEDFYFNNVDYLDTYVKLGSVELTSKESNIFLNKKPVFYEENEEQVQKTIEINEGKKKSIDISKTNKRILNITFLICGIFSIIALVSRNLDRRKYFDK